VVLPHAALRMCPGRILGKIGKGFQLWKVFSMNERQELHIHAAKYESAVLLQAVDTNGVATIQVEIMAQNTRSRVSQIIFKKLSTLER